MEGDYEHTFTCISEARSPKNQLVQGIIAPDSESVATWEPKFGLGFDDELFPAFVLSMNGRSLKPPSDSSYLGDPLGMAEVHISATVANSKVHVEIQVEGFADTSTFDATLPKAGQKYRIAPLLRWNYSRLAGIEQSTPATVIYVVSVNGIELGHQSIPIRVRSVNDVPFIALDPEENKHQDLSFLFAGFVNESHPLVQTMFKEALNWRAVNSFDGYQSGKPDQVRLQVFALWNVLQRRHMHYSNVTTASASSPSGRVYSQAVRFIDQSVESQQANCVDGSVLFASMLYKIGIDPILVMKPGHMFVGYYLDSAHKQAEFLETTMLGAGHQPSAWNLRFSPVLHPVATSESWQQFVSALRFATSVFNQEVLPAVQQKRQHYLLIDIATARKMGVNAIPH